MADLSYEIIETLGVLSQPKNGWAVELNLISWDGRDPKYDIRKWSPDHSRMSKGVSLTKDELINLRDILSELDFDTDEID